MDSSLYVGSQWFNHVSSEISQYRTTLGEKGAKKYRLELLLRVAKRVDDFSQYCGECEAYKKVIGSLVQELSMVVQMPSREGVRKHNKAVTSLVEHLKKVHKLVDKGHYMGMGIGIGMAIGAVVGGALGAALDSPGAGTGIGIALGLAIGAYLDKRARDEGRVI